MVELEMVRLARTHLEKDHMLALFMVRDLQVVEDMELNDLVWSMHQNYCVRSEVAWLLDELEAYLVKQTRYCSTCRMPTDGAPLCNRCARPMRRDCKVTRLAIIARAGVGSGTIRNLRRDEALLEGQAEWEEEHNA